MVILREGKHTVLLKKNTSLFKKFCIYNKRICISCTYGFPLQTTLTSDNRWCPTGSSGLLQKLSFSLKGGWHNSWFCTALQVNAYYNYAQCRQTRKSPQSVWCSLLITQGSVTCQRWATTDACHVCPQTATRNKMVFCNSALRASGNKVNPTPRENATRAYRCCTTIMHNNLTYCVPALARRCCDLLTIFQSFHLNRHFHRSATERDCKCITTSINIQE